VTKQDHLTAGEPELRRLLDDLARLVPTDFVGFADMYQCGGSLSYGRLRGVGDGTAVQLWSGFDGRPSLAPWDPSELPPGERNRFQAGSEPDDEAAQAALDALHRPAGLRHVQRMRVYDGDRFVGYLATHRCADRRPFTEAEKARLRAHEAELVTRLVAWSRASRPTFADEARVLLGREGQVLTACPTARRWLTGERAGELALLASAAGDGAPRIVGALEARFVAMVGDAVSGTLVTLRPAPAPRLRPAAALTPARREVATLAAVGATADEIARHVGCSPETVRSHLKAVYRSLGVASRVELAQRLTGG